MSLPDLVTTSLDAYEAEALRLAHAPHALRQQRRDLVARRFTVPLFDCGRYTRNFEAALIQMFEAWQAGKQPAAFTVADQI